MDTTLVKSEFQGFSFMISLERARTPPREHPPPQIRLPHRVFGTFRTLEHASDSVLLVRSLDSSITLTLAYFGRQKSIHPSSFSLSNKATQRECQSFWCHVRCMTSRCLPPLPTCKLAMMSNELVVTASLCDCSPTLHLTHNQSFVRWLLHTEIRYIPTLFCSPLLLFWSFSDL